MCAAAMPKKDRIPPMSDTENLFLEERNEAIASMYDDKGKLGKWMMFFDVKYIDAMWEKALTLYYKGKLTGIQSIKTSTAAKNPRAGERKSGVIRFKCGPSDDEQLMKSYGRNLIKRFNYSDSCGFISYKTDEQSEMGTRATGNRRNFVYRLGVPKYQYGSDPHTSDEIELPLEVKDQRYVAEVIIDFFDKNDCGIDFSGKWKMTVPNEKINEAWVKAVRLYREGKLTGIQSLYASTRHVDNEMFDTSSMLFKCSPCHKEEVVKEYGRNLIKHLGQYCCSKHIWYNGLYPDKLSERNIAVVFPFFLKVDDYRHMSYESDVDLTNENEDSVLDLLKKMSLKSPR